MEPADTSIRSLNDINLQELANKQHQRNIYAQGSPTLEDSLTSNGNDINNPNNNINKSTTNTNNNSSSSLSLTKRHRDILTKTLQPKANIH